MHKQIQAVACSISVQSLNDPGRAGLQGSSGSGGILAAWGEPQESVAAPQFAVEKVRRHNHVDVRGTA